MTLSEIEQKAVSTYKPVVHNLYQADGSKLMAVGLKRGAVLPEHIAPTKAKLIIIKGEVDFNTATESYRLSMSDSFDIPLKVPHSVVAYNDALFLILFDQN